VTQNEARIKETADLFGDANRGFTYPAAIGPGKNVVGDFEHLCMK
jgi:hypothetical protein